VFVIRVLLQQQKPDFTYRFTRLVRSYSRAAEKLLSSLFAVTAQTFAARNDGLSCC